MQDYDGNGQLDEYMSIYARKGIYKASAPNVPTSLNKKYQSIIDKYYNK